MALFSHVRIVHFMIFAIVILTIFLYSVIYNQEMIEPPVVRSGSGHHLAFSSSSSGGGGDTSFRSVRDNIIATNHNTVESSGINNRVVDEEPSPSAGAFIEDAVISGGRTQQMLDVRIELKDGNRGDDSKSVYNTGKLFLVHALVFK